MNKSENEKKQSNTQLRQLQELKCIGLLAGNIVHSFNNAIGVIRGYADLALRATSSSDRSYAYLKQIIEEANLAQELAKKMLIFTRQKKPEFKQIKINSIVEETVKIFEPQGSFSTRRAHPEERRDEGSPEILPHSARQDEGSKIRKNASTPQIFKESLATSIDIQQDIDATCPVVLADTDQIRQVVINLCNNAIDAMSENGGILKIILKEVNVGASSAEAHERLNEGKYVKLTVSDAGRGMDQDILKQIYEPFFTTKKSGEGAGLGLTVVQEIVSGHIGKIIVESKLGEGTTFDIYFPLVDQNHKKSKG